MQEAPNGHMIGYGVCRITLEGNSHGIVTCPRFPMLMSNKEVNTSVSILARCQLCECTADDNRSPKSGHPRNLQVCHFIEELLDSGPIERVVCPAFLCDPPQLDRQGHFNAVNDASAGRSSSIWNAIHDLGIVQSEIGRMSGIQLWMQLRQFYSEMNIKFSARTSMQTQPNEKMSLKIVGRSDTPWNVSGLICSGAIQRS